MKFHWTQHTREVLYALKILWSKFSQWWKATDVVGVVPDNA